MKTYHSTLCDRMIPKEHDFKRGFYLFLNIFVLFLLNFSPKIYNYCCCSAAVNFSLCQIITNQTDFLFFYFQVFLFKSQNFSISYYFYCFSYYGSRSFISLWLFFLLVCSLLFCHHNHVFRYKYYGKMLPLKIGNQRCLSRFILSTIPCGKVSIFLLFLEANYEVNNLTFNTFTVLISSCNFLFLNFFHH